MYGLILVNPDGLVTRTYRNWNGINFKQYYENNKRNNISLIYEESKVDEFFNSFDSEQQWLEAWYKIKELEHSFIIADITHPYDGYNTIVKPNKVIFTSK